LDYDNLSISSIFTISILFRSYFNIKLKIQDNRTKLTNIIIQYFGSFSHNLVAKIDATIPTIYETNVIIPLDIGSLIGYVNSVQKLYPTDTIGSKQNPNIPILIPTNAKLPVGKVKKIPTDEINDPKDINLIDYK